MTKKLFITATGTDVGKTYLTALLVKKLRQAGRNAGYASDSGRRGVCKASGGTEARGGGTGILYL